MEQLTQKQRILNHLTKHGTITDNDARDLYGTNRLGARIWDLRNKDGIDIVTNMESCKNRFGRKVTYARYSLVQ